MSAKDLARDLSGRGIDEALLDDTARRIAQIRATDEAREGLSAFLEKRKAAWTKRTEKAPARAPRTKRKP